MIFSLEYNYNTRKWHGATCPTWLFRECLHLDMTIMESSKTIHYRELSERIVYVGY